MFGKLCEEFPPTNITSYLVTSRHGTKLGGGRRKGVVVKLE